MDDNTSEENVKDDDDKPAEDKSDLTKVSPNLFKPDLNKELRALKELEDRYDEITEKFEAFSK